MKSHLAKVSLALLSTAFLLGCQEQGSEPVGPDGTGIQAKPGKGMGGGGGGIVVGTLDLEGGMTATGLHVFIGQDSDTKLTVNNGDLQLGISMNFRAAPMGEDYPLPYQQNQCKVIFGSTGSRGGNLKTEEWKGLLAELEASFLAPGIWMEIDKRGLTADDKSTTSDGNLLLVERDGTFDDAPETTHGSTRIMLDDLATVKWISSSGSVDVFEFTGPVMVWARGVGGGGGKKSNRAISCGGAGDNTVTVTLNR